MTSYLSLLAPYALIFAPAGQNARPPVGLSTPCSVLLAPGSFFKTTDVSTCRGDIFQYLFNNRSFSSFGVTRVNSFFS